MARGAFFLKDSKMSTLLRDCATRFRTCRFRKFPSGRNWRTCRDCPSWCRCSWPVRILRRSNKLSSDLAGIAAQLHLKGKQKKDQRLFVSCWIKMVDLLKGWGYSLAVWSVVARLSSPNLERRNIAAENPAAWPAIDQSRRCLELRSKNKIERGIKDQQTFWPYLRFAWIKTSRNLL